MIMNLRSYIRFQIEYPVCFIDSPINFFKKLLKQRFHYSNSGITILYFCIEYQQYFKPSQLIMIYDMISIPQVGNGSFSEELKDLLNFRMLIFQTILQYQLKLLNEKQ